MNDRNTTLANWQERHELAERVMVTRLHLYGKWVKVSNSKIYRKHFSSTCRAHISWKILDIVRTVYNFSFGDELWCRNAIMPKYIKKSLIRTWSWCVNGLSRLWYGPLMTTRRRLAERDCSFYQMVESSYRVVPRLGIFLFTYQIGSCLSFILFATN